MAYWTLGGLYSVLPKDRVLPLVDDEGTGNIVETPPNPAYCRVAAAGAKADTLIETYLRGHYPLPLNPVPQVICDIAAAITAYELYTLADVDEIPAKLTGHYKAAIGLLEHIRDDKIRLFEESQAAVTIQVNKTDADRLFPKSVLDRF